MSPLFWPRLLLWGAIAGALVASGALLAARHYKPLLEAEKRAYAEFRGGVEALGRAAEKRTAETNAANEKRKRDADAENKRAVDSLRADIDRLRKRAADRSGGPGFVPSAAPGARSPDLACFDRVELGAAIGKLVADVRGFADEGDKSAVDLATARAWAAGR